MGISRNKSISAENLLRSSLTNGEATVRLNKKTQECTDSEIIYFIKAWLVRCKDRFNNKNKDRNIAPEEVETTEN